MVRWLGFVLSLLCAASTSQASPEINLMFATRLEVALAEHTPGLASATLVEVDERDRIGHASSIGLVHYRSGTDAARGVARWLLSAAFYSVCLTTGLSGLTDSDQDMIAETLGEPGTLEALVIPDWASGIARALGVMTVEFGPGGVPTTAGRLELTLLPIGPENAAGLSITGCFR